MILKKSEPKYLRSPQSQKSQNSQKSQSPKALINQP